ncbi:hypothetical protein BOX15_Mlig019708g1, partial [Macrostomum lignano]
SASGPYQIRRIEELTKTPTGNVEAKVMCFFRRRDISNNLISQADKHLSLDDEPSAAGEAEAASSEPSGGSLTEVQRHQLRHRELFLSRQVETLPATTIRGKCAVTLLNETEALTSYLARDDAFYYTLTYDTAQKSLLADRGEIRVGGRYQAEVQPLLGDGESDGRDLAQLEELVWRPDHGLSDADIDKYLLVARSVGCLARAVDACSSVRQPGLAAAAAAASRDYTQAHAYRMLHSSKYDLGRAFCRLVTDSGPVLCRDQLEDWSASECNLFEEAMNKFGKDFNEIRRDYLSWKSMRSIVEYFYMWKTTDRYVQQKRLKASEAEKKLKQVYIPNYTKPNPGVLYNRPELPGSSRCCESCSGTATSNGQWFAWGPPHLSCRLCSSCWNYWKRYGGLKNPTRAEKSPSPAPSAASGAGSSGRVFRCPVVDCDKEFRLRPQLVRHAASAHGLDEASLQSMQAGKVKAVKSMLMRANATAQLASLLCSDLLRVRRLARRPFNAAFDAKPALLELPKRCQADGRGVQQLLDAAAARRAELRRRRCNRLPPGQLDARLRIACPSLDTDAKPDILLEPRSRAAGEDAATKRRAFAPVSSAQLAEFFLQLDERRAAAAAAAPSPAAPAANGNSLMPSAATARKRSQPEPQQNCGFSSAAKVQRLDANGNGNGEARPTKLDSAGAAAAAAEEILLFDTKRFRAHLTGAQLKRAGRRPFKLLPGAKKPPQPVIGEEPPVARAAHANSNGIAVKSA